MAIEEDATRAHRSRSGLLGLFEPFHRVTFATASAPRATRVCDCLPPPSSQGVHLVRASSSESAGFHHFTAISAFGSCESKPRGRSCAHISLPSYRCSCRLLSHLLRTKNWKYWRRPFPFSLLSSAVAGSPSCVFFNRYDPQVEPEASSHRTRRVSVLRVSCPSSSPLQSSQLFNDSS